MAIKTYTAGTIEDLETGEVEDLVVFECDTAEDLAALLDLDFDSFEAAPGEFVPTSGLIDYEDRF